MYARTSLMRTCILSAVLLVTVVTTTTTVRAQELPPEARVRSEFLHAWLGYKAFAWRHDEFMPLSREPKDWYSESLFMTAVDGFDTLLLMGLSQEASTTRDVILSELSFDKDMDVQVFEITIRLLGGLLSSYQLDGSQGFLDLAKELGDRLLPAFDSPTGMPYVYVNLKTGVTSRPVNNPAEIGTLMLEFGTLSKLTGDPVYYEKAKRGIQEVYRRRSEIGLVGTTIDVESGAWGNTRSHIGGRIDSYYEYLYKAWRLFGDPDFKTMWDTSIAAVNRYVADETPDGLWYGQVDMASGERVGTRFGALEAFMPGLLAYSGDTERAARLMDSCYRMWMKWGIEPEQIDYNTWQITSPGYVLRPENIESAWYLFKITGDEKYREMGRAMFDSVRVACRDFFAYHTLADVRTKEARDSMPSFFLAETLKYAYLLEKPDLIDLDQVVFTTEAHPLRATWRE